MPIGVGATVKLVSGTDIAGAAAPLAVTVMLAGPSGSGGSGTTSCGFTVASARSRRLTTWPPTLADSPVIPDVNVTVNESPTRSHGAKIETGAPAYATFGRSCAGGGGGLSQPQPAFASRGAPSAASSAISAIRPAQVARPCDVAIMAEGEEQVPGHAPERRRSAAFRRRRTSRATRAAHRAVPRVPRAAHVPD